MLIVLLLMKTLWVWFCVIIAVTGSNEYSSNGGGGGGVGGGLKYSAKQNRQNIPSLASLFNVITYWDKNNASSPCSHSGKKRDLECTKVVTFDRAGYDKSIEDMKKLILSRLNLDHEPSIKVNQKTMRFIDQLENRVLADESSGGDDVSVRKQPAVLKTKYDMKSPENRVFNVMHEASSIAVGCLGEDDVDTSTSLCINFEVSILFSFA